MKPLSAVAKHPGCYRIVGSGPDGLACLILHPKGHLLQVIASTGGGWDHVSVSLESRCPSWDEMAFVKGIFFFPEEPAMELHPPASTYRNLHPFCLHLWRPQRREIPLPPLEFV
ncbi:MAG TPA: hypothetical protein PLE19_12890 [Planctomycetota bacterium]|nr:hypothetical protein [Planctomycetota bacterium]HRT94790.1 hypothetical protein [Planctomycetota bacterium]